MFLSKLKYILTVFSLLAIMAASALSQAKQGDGSPSQRAEVMRQKLETIRRSAASSASVLKDESKDEKAAKDDKTTLDTPFSRLKTIEKEASRLQSEVNTLRGKIDRSEKYEASEMDQLEASVGDLQTRADAVLVETASARANPESEVGKSREVKKKKK